MTVCMTMISEDASEDASEAACGHGARGVQGVRASLKGRLVVIRSHQISNSGSYESIELRGRRIEEPGLTFSPPKTRMMSELPLTDPPTTVGTGTRRLW